MPNNTFFENWIFEAKFTEQVAIKQIEPSQDTKKANKADWDREARSLSDINGLNHNHIVKCLAAISRGDELYFAFPWARGGSLRDFWNETPDQKPRLSNVRHAVYQLRGLADALFHLHNFQLQPAVQNTARKSDSSASEIPRVLVEGNPVRDDHQKFSIRHGDLKPENILMFTEGQEKFGTLKIADMGLAKRHFIATVDRKTGTGTTFGTLRYEAPEAELQPTQQGRSRLYDVWSMGCITLEYIIWILYGNLTLKTFYGHFTNERHQDFQYYDVKGGKAEVHYVVRQWIDHLLDKEPECSGNSAIRDLLQLVKTKLLVVNLPPRRPSMPLEDAQDVRSFHQFGLGDDSNGYRTTAKGFCDALDKIIIKLNDENYVLTSKSRDKRKLPTILRKGSSLIVEAVTVHPAREARYSSNISRTISRDYSLPPLQDWEFPVDNEFAEKVVARLDPKSFYPGGVSKVVSIARLCSRCEKLDFWDSLFEIEDQISDLIKRSRSCQFCEVLLRICERFEQSSNAKVFRFERRESSLRLSGLQTLPVLSICCSPGQFL